MSSERLNETKKSNFLLEVGSDEIPAGLLSSAISSLRDRARIGLLDQRLTFDQIETFGAPRRLVLYVKNLSLKSLGKEEKVRGPSKKVAFDAEGNPTKALLGFCRSLGISPEEVTIEQNQSGEYIYGLKRDPGKAASKIISEIIPNIVMGMDCPRPLRWGDENFRWYRPIRWIVCLLGDEIIPVEMAGHTAGRTSFGHRTLCPEPIEIDSADSYFSQIEKAGVLVDQEKRKDIIWQGAMRLSAQLGGKPLEDEELLEEVSNLAEHPAPFLGRFSKTYLELPKDVLITVMRHHQRYFPIVGESGQVLSGFIGVRDGDPQIGMDTVISGNQVVLKARLEDASFFYLRDKEEKLEDRQPGLKGVYFLRNAGTLWDKVERLRKMEEHFTDFIGPSFEVPRALLSQAVALCKCDLLTLMVREFPELEGVMGGHYAKDEGLDPEVCKALAQQYLPRGVKDKLPDKGIPAILALMDKLDTLSMAFCLGMKPTGSQDPIGLRRMAQGVVSIIEAYDLDLDLDSVLSFSTALSWEFLKRGCEKDSEKDCEKNREKSREKAKGELLDFLLGRVEAHLVERGYPLEIVRAVLLGKEKRIARLPKMARALSEYPRLSDVAIGWRRTSILAKSAMGRKVRQELLAEEAEITLYNEVISKKGVARDLFEKALYTEYLDILAQLRRPIDQCLDKVLIMAREDEVKNNRLNLLALTSDLFTSYADFAYVLPLLGEEK